VLIIDETQVDVIQDEVAVVNASARKTNEGKLVTECTATDTLSPLM
jgi:hypothetical protein